VPHRRSRGIPSVVLDLLSSMRIPPLVLSPSPLGIEFVRFATSEVAGTAIREKGERESHYDIGNVRLRTAPSAAEMREAPPDSCAFDVVGVVDEVHDDGLCIVEACGFDFWIAPEDVPAGCRRGSVLAFRVTNFALYI
jgi:hypothetical protein